MSTVAARVPVIRGWLIEPQAELTKHLKEIFPTPRYEVHWLALTDHPGTVRLEVSRGTDVTASLLPIKSGLAELSHLPLGEKYYEQCPAETLDRFVSTNGISDISLLKIDTQGNELQIFQAGCAALSRTRAVWSELSFRQLYEDACLIQDVVDFLRAEGLYLRAVVPEFLGPTGELLQVNGLFTRNPAH
jgi:FkbM family methyltransferase